MNFNITSTNKEMEDEGVWLAYPLSDEIEVRIARFNTERVQKHLRLLLAKNRKAMRQPKEQEKVTRQLLVDMIILDWKGIKVNDEDFPYSKENATILVSAEKLKDFIDWISNQSQDMLNFLDDQDEESLQEAVEQAKK